LRTRRSALALTVVALLLASLAAGAALASAPPKPVTSNKVPVSGAVVTQAYVRAAVKNNRLTVTLMPGKLPFAKKSVSLKGKVSDWSASMIEVSIKKSGPRKGTGRVIVTGPLNSEQPDVAVYEIDWTLATTNTGTLKLTPEEP
jgi:ABC-type proline/glycine betaine transport system substrate-binding protein